MSYNKGVLCVAISTEALLTRNWYQELNRVLSRLVEAQMSLGLQPAMLAHVEYDRNSEMVYVYPKHYQLSNLYVRFGTAAIQDAFLKMYNEKDPYGDHR